MADHKQFPATRKKIDQALKDGNVPKSRDLTPAILLTSCLYLIFSAGWVGSELIALFRQFFTLGSGFPTNNMLVFLREAFWLAFELLAPFFSIVVLLVTLVEGLQVGALRFSSKPLTFQWSRLSPAENAKRLWCGDAAGPTKLFSEIFKLGVYGIVAACSSGFVIRQLFQLEFAGAVVQNSAQIAALAQHYSCRLVFFLGGLSVLAGFLDYLISRLRWLKRLRMGSEELKREYRESEGDPEMRSMRKQMHSEFLLQRVVEGVRRAKVVISNRAE